MINRISILIIILFQTAVLSAQNHLEMQKEYAESLFTGEKYFDAVTEYKRLMFFDENKIYSAEAGLKIAYCYKSGGKFDDAIAVLSKMKENQQINKTDIEIEIIRLNILRGTYFRAFGLIEKLEREVPEKQSELNYWKGWSYMVADEWQKAADAFGNSAEKGTEILKNLCISVSEEKYSLSFARTISYILPGAGHFYTGYFIEGIISLGWNVLWGYDVVNAIKADRIFDAVMVGNFLWLRFYTGGSQEAVKLAEIENRKIINAAYKYLSIQFEGKQP